MKHFHITATADDGTRAQHVEAQRLASASAWEDVLASPATSK